MKKILLLIMTLNEIDGVKTILPKINRELFSKILVVDGNSTDGTIEWLKNNNFDIYLQGRPGIRYGMLDGINSVVEHFDFVLTFSPDGNCDIEFLPTICEKIQTGDAKIYYGSRYYNGGKSKDDDLITAFGNWLFTNVLNFLYKSKLSDGMVIYRAFDRSVIKELCLDDEKSYVPFEKYLKTKIGWEPLMSIRAAKYKIKTEDIYVGEPKRIGGERKLQIFRWGAAFFGQLFRELWYVPIPLRRDKKF
jgi:glycosyltransferase involved in cell wall biosynthesis